MKLEFADLLSHSSWIYLASEWIIRGIMLLYVPQRRSPSAARTWLLLIFIQPWIGLVAYAIFGRVYLPRRRVELQEKVSALLRTVGRGFVEQHGLRPEMSADVRQMATLAENLGDFSIVSGNNVELLDDYQGAIDRLVADIDAAVHHAHLLFYIFADDATGRRVADALIAAAHRGVICRLLVDSMASKHALRKRAPAMRRAGIEVVALLPGSLWRRDRARLDLRNHRKIVVIDGRIGYVGSQNMVDADFKPPLVYEELVARITGPAVLQLQAVLLGDRAIETEKTLENRDRFFPEPRVVGDMSLQVLPSGPGYAHANNQRLVVSLVHSARRRVVMTTPYFVPDEPLLQALESAVLRGVEVHLIVSRQADQFLVGFAQRSFYEQMLVAGVRIHEYLPRFLHAKHLSIDDSVALIGSSNMDLRSFLLNAEVSIVAYDPTLVARLAAIQERTMRDGAELTLDAWRKRGTLTRLLQNVARMVDSLL